MSNPKTIRIFLVIFGFFVLAAVFPQSTQAQCATGEIDLLDYMIPSVQNTKEIRHQSGATEYFYTYQAGVNPDTGRQSFYIVKNLSGENFEEFNYDDQYIYHLKDSTWATGPNEPVRCQDNDQPAYFTLIDGYHGRDAYQFFDPADEGGIITKRCVTRNFSGEPHGTTVVGFSLETCRPCPTALSGDFGQRVSITYLGSYSFPNGWLSSDVLRLTSATGEVFYYTQQHGWVGFEGSGFQSYFTGNTRSDNPQANLACSPFARTTDLTLPPNLVTEWGSPVYGRGIPCGPLGSNQSGPSPWRPFPGDSPRDSCYDLTEITPPGENERQWITTYCNPAPIITDIIRWFPLPDPANPGADIKSYFLRPGELKTWWIDQTRATQIPFLGSSNTSPQQFSQASQRMSLFLTDFLRGIVYWDRQQVQPNNSAEYRRVLDESGPIRKLYPRDFLSGGEADDWKEEFIRCRLRGGTNCDRLVSTDQVHDYLLRNNSRLSTVSQLLNPVIWDRYFPLTSREDIPAFVDLGISTVWPDDPETIPGIRVFPEDPTVPSSISLNDLYNALANGGGYYWIALPWSSSISNLPLYELHFVEMVYVPYVPESKELAQWAARPLMPFAFEDQDSSNYWLNDSSLQTLALDNPFGRSLNCNVNDIARGGPGDVLAGDNPANLGKFLNFYNEWESIVTSTDPSQWGCFTPLHNPNYQPLDRLHFPERTENVFTRNTGEYPEWPYAWVTTKIPYLETIARRTIGRGGLFRALLPRSFTHSVVSAIDEVAQGRIWWYELPGYGPADYDYENFLEEQEDRPHWGFCDPVPPEKCDASVSSCNLLYNCSQACDGCELVELGTEHQCKGDCVVRISRCCTPEEGICDRFWPVAVRQCRPDQPGETCSCENAPYQANCIIEESGFSGEAPCWCYCEEGGSTCGPRYGPTLDSQDRDVRGRGEVSDAEARFYYPYIGTIDIFRQYMRDQMVPHNFFQPRTQ